MGGRVSRDGIWRPIGCKMSDYDYTKADRQRLSRERRARAYMIVKALAQRSGRMTGPLDTVGLDRYMDDFQIDGGEVDWFEAADDLE